MKRYRQIAGFILAGGESSRMGRDKGLLDFGGAPLLLRTAQTLEPLVGAVTVVGSPFRYTKLGLRVIADNGQIQDGLDNPRRGPLAGIAVALATTSLSWNLIVACDLPYLSAQWLDWLLSRAMRSRGDAVIPRTERGIEPLVAVYRRECSATITTALERGVRKVSDAIKDLRLDFVYPLDWSRVEASDLVLRNMNAPSDYEEARTWWAANCLKNDHVKIVRLAPKRNRRSVPRRSK